MDKIHLTPIMNENIVGILRIDKKNATKMYAAKLIESLQEKVRDLEARLGVGKENG